MEMLKPEGSFISLSGKPALASVIAGSDESMASDVPGVGSLLALLQLKNSMMTYDHDLNIFIVNLGLANILFCGSLAK